ncbi:hypothetical protein K490DRAFT_56088 [Saccharata proteae CBS 121410]|uniref:Uncharacterized protein n=1 Tax=Saccharata proteae CBS 121410 TaxID=1314787 RepID=A0A9P4HX81_9PEZI|nr:hypothetical protein K490DRAFT_56088 [Saccharata proteae CBS 121410]
MAEFLARSLTTKRARKPEKISPTPSRSFSMKRPSGKPIDRVQISAPLTLLSTTNMLSYHAPDISSLRNASSESSSSPSRTSNEDSDRSSNSSGSRGPSTDASSLESLASSPEMNHLTGYFESAQRAQNLKHSASESKLQMKPSYSPLSSKPVLRPFAEDSPRPSQDSRPSLDRTPAIPQRARSHSKEAHERIARKRSLRNVGPPSSLHSRSSSTQEQRSSVDMFKGNIDASHPFGKELEQLNEVVEELGGVMRDAALDEDAKLMQEKGLLAFCAADYMAEITPFLAVAYDMRLLAPTPTLSTAWI